METQIAPFGLKNRLSANVLRTKPLSRRQFAPSDSFQSTGALKFKGGGQQLITPKLQREAAIVAHATEEGAKTFAKVSAKGAKVLLKTTGVVLAESAQGGKKLFQDVERLIAANNSDPEKAPLVTAATGVTTFTAATLAFGPFVTVPATIAALTGYNRATASDGEEAEQAGTLQGQAPDEFEMIGDRQSYTRSISAMGGFPSANPFTTADHITQVKKPDVKTAVTDKTEEASLEEINLDSRPPSTTVIWDLAVNDVDQVVEENYALFAKPGHLQSASRVTE